MSDKAHLRVVPPPEFDGEFTEANFRTVVEQNRELRVLLGRAEDRVKGLDLQIARMQADLDETAAADPNRPKVDVLVACWKAACNRRSDPSAEELLKACARVKKLGLARCLKAIAGAAYDPTKRERRNGTVERFDKFELIFRSPEKTQSFVDRAPVNWTPDPDKVAAIADVPVEKVKAWL